MKLVMDKNRRISDQSYYMKRINRLKQRVISTRPEMDLENARILTHAFKQSQGEPLVVQKA
ncbi:MAG: hypothetical protein HKP52_10200, partial [Desulfofustis sp.]|nr:hypothetical protein [Desulfofustis sp.]